MQSRFEVFITPTLSKTVKICLYKGLNMSEITYSRWIIPKASACLSWSSSWCILRCVLDWCPVVEASLSSSSFLTDCVAFVSRVCWNLLESILPSYCVRFPVPLAATQPQSTTDPSLYHRYRYHQSLQPKSSMLNSSAFPKGIWFIYIFSCRPQISQVAYLIDFCDEVAGKVSFWWFFHADHVLQPTQQSSMVQSNSCVSWTFLQVFIVTEGLVICFTFHVRIWLVLSEIFPGLLDFALTLKVLWNCYLLMTFQRVEIVSWKHFIAFLCFVGINYSSLNFRLLVRCWEEPMVVEC